MCWGEIYHDISYQEAYYVCTNVNHKGLQRTANEYAEELRIYKDLISRNNNVDILNLQAEYCNADCTTFGTTFGTFII